MAVTFGKREQVKTGQITLKYAAIAAFDGGFSGA